MISACSQDKTLKNNEIDTSNQKEVINNTGTSNNASNSTDNAQNSDSDKTTNNTSKDETLNKDALSNDTGNDKSNTSSDEASLAVESVIDTSKLFSSRDLEASYDERKSVIIQLNGDSATSTSKAVTISGATVTITDEGTYILSGTLNDGMIVVNADKKDKIQLVLNNVSIHSKASAPIFIQQADKVFITLASKSVNDLSNGGSFAAIDGNNIDAVIYSKDDLTLNGSGSLTINSPAGHGIVSKDELTLTGGNYNINSASHGMTGKDNICIVGSEINITSGKDGIHADNQDDSSLGFIYIQGGTFNITSEGDGIASSAWMQIDDGSFNIVSGGGSAKAEKKTSDFGGGFMGGDFMGGGRPGRGPGPGYMEENPASDSANTDTEDESISSKGIKANGNLIFKGGNFTLDTVDDAVHSNTYIQVDTGTFKISTGDDGFHADEKLTITSGTINIRESYEGLEALHVEILGGDLTIYSSDDGINAAGGTDESGFGGAFPGRDRFGGHGGGASNGSISISGGKLYINASGDGIDANGTLTITGGYIVVCGPTVGDTATLDFDVSGTISGATFIGTGSSFMAQSFSDSDQGVIGVKVNNQAAGIEITLKDSGGNIIIGPYLPELSFEIVILSSPNIIKGETYTLTIGSLSNQLTAK